MASLVVAGDVSGSVTLSAPSAAGSVTITLPSSSGTMAVTGGSPSFATLTVTGDASISGLTVGKGGGAVSTNTAIGSSALNANTTATRNTGVGYRALYVNTASLNAAFGDEALVANTTGTQNTAVGSQAGLAITTGSNNTAIGRVSMYANTITGDNNTGVGAASLLSLTSGASNTAIGHTALYSNTTASDNTAVGYQALYSNTTGFENTAVGRYALNANTTASYNTAIGRNSLLNCTTGTHNTVIGHNSGDTITTGTKNTILGRYNGNQGGLDIRTASNYIVLSDGDGNPRGVFNSSGSFMVGKTDNAFTSVGADMQSDGELRATRNGAPCLSINRLTSDGILVQFFQDTVIEGNIAVAGTTVSYNGGHLSRWSQLPSNQKEDTLLKGTVMSNLDDMCVWVKDGEELPNEQLNKMKVSDVEGDTNVAGVFVSWQYDEQCQSDDMNVAMTGDMIIRIAQGVVVQKGDLLMSAGDGTAKPQGDDIRRSKTVAKVTSNHVTCTYEDGSYCVPCVLMAC